MKVLKPNLRRTMLALGVTAAVNLAAISAASAHCDSMDGPVIGEAQIALRDGDISPLLKWVPAADEAAIKQAFEEARQVRGLGPAAQRLADQHFFETLVMVHRASEGAPFTGVKPAGGIEPAVMAADAALESGDVDTLVAKISARVERGIRDRFEQARTAKATAGQSVEQGRDFVERYVQYVHYVENVHESAAGDHGHAAQSAMSATHTQ